MLRLDSFCRDGRQYREPDEGARDRIFREFDLAFRGHQLCEVHRVLLAKATGGGVNARPDGLLDLLTKLAPSCHIKRLEDEIRLRLEASGDAPAVAGSG